MGILDCIIYGFRRGYPSRRVELGAFTFTEGMGGRDWIPTAKRLILDREDATDFVRVGVWHDAQHGMVDDLSIKVTRR